MIRLSLLYSIRQGTPAARAEDQIPEEINMRFNRLVEVINESSAEKTGLYRGKNEDGPGRWDQQKQRGEA